MTMHDFLNRLKILNSLDRHEIPCLTLGQWHQFVNDPYKFLMRADDAEIFGPLPRFCIGAGASVTRDGEEIVAPVQRPTPRADDLARVMAENARLRALVKRSLSAVSAAYTQADAEWRNRDREASRCSDEVRLFQQDARDALAQEPTP